MNKSLRLLDKFSESVTVVSPLAQTLAVLNQDTQDELDNFKGKLEVETRPMLVKFYKKKIDDLTKTLKGINDMMDSLEDDIKSSEVTKKDIDKAYNLVMEISRSESSFGKRSDLEKLLSIFSNHEYDMDTSPVVKFNLDKVKEIYSELSKVKTYNDYVDILGGKSLDVYLKNLYSDPSKRFRPEE